MKNIFLVCLFGIASLQAMENDTEKFVLNPCLQREHFNQLNKLYENASDEEIQKRLNSIFPAPERDVRQLVVENKNRSFTCNLCTSILNSKKSMQNHLGKHKNSNKPTCPYCPYHFSHEQSYLHLNACHPDRFNKNTFRQADNLI